MDRWRRGSLWIVVLGLALVVGASAQTAIPNLSGTTFAGAKVRLPDALAGKAGVLVVGFSQGSRDEVTVWGKRLAEDYFDSPAVVFYAMPVLAGAPGFMRGFIAGRIKAAVSERGRVHFLPIYEDEAGWRAACAYSPTHADDAYVLLVDSSGQVVWKTQGPASDAVYEALRGKLEALRKGR